MLGAPTDLSKLLTGRQTRIKITKKNISSMPHGFKLIHISRSGGHGIPSKPPICNCGFGLFCENRESLRSREKVRLNYLLPF